MEFCDVYAPDGKLTGKIIPRGVELGADERTLIVFAWIFNRERKLLMTMRHPDKKIYPSVWDVPGGGARAGESGLDAVLREAFEEVGIKLDAAGARLASRRMSERRIFEDWIFYRDAKLSELILQPDEVTEARWMDLDEITEMDAANLLVPSLLPLYESMFAAH